MCSQRSFSPENSFGAWTTVFSAEVPPTAVYFSGLPSYLNKIWVLLEVLYGKRTHEAVLGKVLQPGAGGGKCEEDVFNLMVFDEQNRLVASHQTVLWGDGAEYSRWTLVSGIKLKVVFPNRFLYCRSDSGTVGSRKHLSEHLTRTVA